MPIKISNAERHAEQATTLTAFPINLNDVKRVVTEILSLFGRSNIFAEYTVHDIRHIDDMLSQLDWLVPENTKQILAPADWLLIVMSIYFHDMGLIVTEEEYNNRTKSDFFQFCETHLFSGTDGADYKSKVATLDPDKRERFLYQEFVRANHGKRVREWIEGRDHPHFGVASAQVAEIDRLLGRLVPEFRRDLALVCESHSLDDIDNTNKYPLSQPYGNSDDESANVQYCAAILRTVDLLQITQSRTPTTLFRLISPTDPISQSEWSKQNAVRRVRYKSEIDRDGNIAESVQAQTVEVYANFHDEDSFFGLTSYLKYAESQLNSTYTAIQNSSKKNSKKFEFPWRDIDTKNVKVEGFLTTPFTFVIDQEKILNLLTGHTLYNDSNVVVRELTQNAIDAVRLQASIDRRDSASTGTVKIVWNSNKSELSIIDNGTGMTQAIIENHLLKVGSSR
ncbi:HD domain-containing protein [Methylobacterium oryzisoli]|uniref:HD domain-containing protein n=1 Tax=Methylobacterium oryzisoli TaxID=3385502 RepID=UPI00389224EE